MPYHERMNFDSASACTNCLFFTLRKLGVRFRFDSGVNYSCVRDDLCALEKDVLRHLEVTLDERLQHRGRNSKSASQLIHTACYFGCTEKRADVECGRHSGTAIMDLSSLDYYKFVGKNRTNTPDSPKVLIGSGPSIPWRIGGANRTFRNAHKRGAFGATPRGCLRAARMRESAPRRRPVETAATLASECSIRPLFESIAR